MTEASGIQVLHVDDEPDFVETAADMLEREDSRFSVETATSASDGLDRLTVEEFDCIVSGYQMPGQDGIEFLETVREEYSDLPFILYTRKGSEGVASDALSAGANDYLQKGSSTDQYELLANRITNAIEQHRASRRADKLDRVRTIRSEINQALIRSKSRSDAEARICEIISNSKPYLFAWIGDTDPETDHIEPRASVGVEEDYLKNITVTADSTATGHGPGGTAVRERRVAVSQNIHEDPEFEPWRQDALERGYQSVGAVPLEYGDTLYGVLGVYSERPYAFDEDEKELFVELGADIAHTFHSFEIQQNRILFKQLIDQSNDEVYVTDAETGIIQRVNQTACDHLGYTEEELVGMAVPEISEGTDKVDEWISAIEGVQKQGGAKIETVHNRADGTTYPVGISSSYVEMNDEQYVVTFARNITERKDREKKITRLKERLELAVEGTNLGVWDWDLTTDEVIFNDNWATMLGYDPEEIDSHLDEWEKRVHPDDIEEVEAALDEHIADETEYYDTEHRMRTADGDWKWVHDVGKIFERDDEGEPVRAVGIHIDIDERKRVQRSLREERDMFTQGPAVVFKWREDDGWPVEYVSENVTDVLGYSPEQLQSGEVPFSELIHDDDIDRVRREVERNSDPDIDRFSHEPYRVLTSDGDVRWILDHTKNVREDGDITHRLGYLIDVTARKERERQLQQFREAVEQTAHVVYITDTDGTIEYVNPAFEEITGFSESEAVGQDPSILKSGEYGDEYYEELWETILSGEQWTEEIFEEGADGEEIVLNQTISPITDEDGQPQKFVAVGQDTTQQKEYEQKLEEQRDNLEVLNQVVRHDIRNDMNVVQARAELLENHIDEAGQENLESVLDATKSAIGLTTTARNLAETMLSRQEDVEPVRLDDLLRDLIENARAEFQDVVISVEKIPDIRVHGNELLEAVFRNLIHNAVVHNDKQTPTVQISTTVGTETSRVVVADNGPGIPDDQKETIFGKGETGLESPETGIGLYLVQTLVEQYGGEVWVEDNDPEGSVFIVELPVAE